MNSFQQHGNTHSPISDATAHVQSKTSAAVDQVSEAAEATMNKASEVVATARGKSEVAINSANEVLGNVRHAIESSAKSQPTTTVLMAVATGFLLGMTWKSGR